MQNKNKAYSEPKINYKKIILKIKDNVNHNTIKLKEKDDIQIKIKGYDGFSRAARVKKIFIENEPNIKVVYFNIDPLMQKSREAILPLSQIEYIQKIPTSLYVTIKFVAVLSTIISVAAILEDSNNLLLASPFIAASATGFLIRNRKHYIDQSDVEVIYK